MQRRCKRLMSASLADTTMPLARGFRGFPSQDAPRGERDAYPALRAFCFTRQLGSKRFPGSTLRVAQFLSQGF